ncbi:MAG TPA: DUF1398 family protein [Candidatus Dormibacteraeota bacterium]|nr:DUF1398 family protein [Candidatus Dormibacteraeota bacterium]
MFTIEQINDLHDRLGSPGRLAQYLRALHAIGVETSDSFLTDGHSEFFGKDGHQVMSVPAHETFTIADASSREGLLEHLRLATEGTTSYVEMSRGLADSGVEKWTFDMNEMTIAYYDKAGNELLVEEIR